MIVHTAAKGRGFGLVGSLFVHKSGEKQQPLPSALKQTEMVNGSLVLPARPTVQFKHVADAHHDEETNDEASPSQASVVNPQTAERRLIEDSVWTVSDITPSDSAIIEMEGMEEVSQNPTLHLWDGFANDQPDLQIDRPRNTISRPDKNNWWKEHGVTIGVGMYVAVSAIWIRILASMDCRES
ncbi:MAG: hypothetical protein KVP17_001998 [Porospora cf. gigantea B]|uniref:uncharacterized protein n=1 Tax=Porospora cf. gigantea B TaxID=2853592 RepID=UPI003571F230|nr:MAG: hypothetical protein KVP17_001998 [Porospora cf. gigantea B]